MWWLWNRECVGCGEDREYGNDRRWTGMKSVWKRQYQVKYETEIFGKKAGHYGFGGRKREREGLTILEICRGRPIRMNSVLERLRVR